VEYAARVLGFFVSLVSSRNFVTAVAIEAEQEFRNRESVFYQSRAALRATR
jgi:hypothetical protein